jgi:hypothetical protein
MHYFLHFDQGGGAKLRPPREGYPGRKFGTIEPRVKMRPAFWLWAIFPCDTEARLVIFAPR